MRKLHEDQSISAFSAYPSRASAAFIRVTSQSYWDRLLIDNVLLRYHDSALPRLADSRFQDL